MFSSVKKWALHFFYPHRTNNYRAKTLHLSYFIFYIIFLIGIQTGSRVIKNIFPDVLGYASNMNVEKILDLVNAERVKNNLEPLTISTELTTAATQKAGDMFTYNYWAHISPTGATPWIFITKTGYKYIYAGENLAKSFDNSDDVVKAWMNSTTHRANILKPEYKEIGLAVMNGKLQGEDTTLVVQEFGSRSLAVASSGKQIQTTPPIETNAQAQGVGAGEIKTVQSGVKSLIPRQTSKNISLFIAEFLLAVLCIDAYYMWKHKTTRLSGHSIAHIIFLLALIGAMGATGVGVIL